jgi:hypothetical protein
MGFGARGRQGRRPNASCECWLEIGLEIGLSARATRSKFVMME